MKRIVRLTESDLTRIVRRVVSESRGLIYEGTGQAAYDKIWWAMAGPGTNNGNVKAGVMMIQTKQDYQELLNLVKSKQSKNTVMAWIATDMDYASSGYDKTQSAQTMWPGQREQNAVLSTIEAHLKKFNSAETIV